MNVVNLSGNPQTRYPRLLGVVPMPEVVVRCVTTVFSVWLMCWSLQKAYWIRTFALKEYGHVIHEFDPWFNYRASLYLLRNGWGEFFRWFDYESWYPLGRPVGTTIYPGLQITAVAVHWALRALGPQYAGTMNWVCCHLPCWGGVLASFVTGLLAWETSGKFTAAAATAAVMAVIPAHLMRSVGGGFDNECIAIFAMVLTFYTWVRSLRSEKSWPIGLLAGLSYGYMVAAWGGFIFVLNMVALHAALIALLDWAKGVYNTRIHRSYTLFFIVGTCIAVCVPPVGWMPFKSLEQLSAFVVFIALQVLEFTEILRRKANVPVHSHECLRIRIKFITILLASFIFICALLVPTGFFGPLSSRIRGLFIPHIRTGNPLVDSVAEHQPANYFNIYQKFHITLLGWFVGTFTIQKYINMRPYTVIFCILNSSISYMISFKMKRLIIIAAPIASICTGILLTDLATWCIAMLLWDRRTDYNLHTKSLLNHSNTTAESNKRRPLFIMFILLALAGLLSVTLVFIAHSDRMSTALSNPVLMFKKTNSDGQEIIVDDYREAYHWLRDKTPKNSRVLAWWDYGYQITGIGERTTLADGNTWNHEHIAFVGMMLTLPIDEAHRIIRHLADYVLIWAGDAGPDLRKSYHIIRIAKSVFPSICTDPNCSEFGFINNDHSRPTLRMNHSVLYQMHCHQLHHGIVISDKYFELAYHTKNGLVRIFKVVNVSKESKDWVANPKNRKCDYPGSFHCSGQYPPAPEVQRVLAKKTDFSQLEDFNK